MIQSLSKSKNKAADSTKKSIALQQSSINQNVQDIALQSQHMVKFVVNTNSRQKYMAKLLRVKDHEITRLLMVVCEMRANEINVKVVEVISLTVL